MEIDRRTSPSEVLRKVTNFNELKKKVGEEEDLGKLRALLFEPSDDSIRGCIDRQRVSGQDDLFVLLGVVAREAGFKDVRQVKLLYGALMLLGIPVRQIKTGFYVKRNKKGDLSPQYYYVALAKHKGIIKEALSNDPSLQGFKKNPVKQV